MSKNNNNAEIEHLWGGRSRKCLLQPSIYKEDSDPLYIPDVYLPRNIPVLSIFEHGSPKDDRQYDKAIRYVAPTIFNLREQSHWELILKMIEQMAKRRPATFVRHSREMEIED